MQPTTLYFSIEEIRELYAMTCRERAHVARLLHNRENTPQATSRLRCREMMLWQLHRYIGRQLRYLERQQPEHVEPILND